MCAVNPGFKFAALLVCGILHTPGGSSFVAIQAEFLVGNKPLRSTSFYIYPLPPALPPPPPPRKKKKQKINTLTLVITWLSQPLQETIKQFIFPNSFRKTSKIIGCLRNNISVMTFNTPSEGEGCWIKNYGPNMLIFILYMNIIKRGSLKKLFECISLSRWWK